MNEQSEAVVAEQPAPIAAASSPAVETKTAGEPILQAKNVDLFYGAAQALWDVSLSAEAGKVSALMGRNGVGKTSFLRAVVGEQPISGGSILFDGKPLGRMAPHDRARLGIAYVPQGRDIFPLLTVKENLETGFAPLKRADRTIPSDIFDLFPVLDSMLRRRGGDLSGGQQQQLAIARALVTRPRLLVLDEPTEGIQPSIIKDIGRAIEYLRDKGTIAILLVEQYFDFVHELADTFAVLDRGHVVASGTREDLDPEKVRRHLTV
ncbi:amino acid/amide ABC transporter ATP-binding protein 2, HAAT family (TC 3.A.1.4.-) [Bauldia litoralis]|uniref:Amino acid/amide ABC transporter ATP-binding protein 2, HAAT family (TC 3.A.1.4.-) n=1 Tax=Bauldia litoralis TaxID=665467 RepID=A0A1G6CPA0_9HYPH|nr:amino acid/amide ABC transporter ATP-binding protein 2, HAAT family (TC 3.A.1.4.-) [Bauldia litoralis]